jgi:L-iditol 2-dehydrogenase
MQLPESYRAACLLGTEQIEIRDFELPEPQAGELTLRVDVATTCGTDVKVFKQGSHPRMLQVPSPFGHECAGTVVAVGEGVEHQRPGDVVVVLNSASCGRCQYCTAGRENLCRDLLYLNGAFADYLPVPARFVRRSTYPVPAGLSAEHACLTEPLACVLHGVGGCSLSAAKDVVVLGGGPIGQLLVGVLASEGHRVVLLDPHPGRREVAIQMGADAALEPVDSEAVAGILGSAESSLGFDLAVDATGTVAGWELAALCVRPGGEVLFFGGCPPGTRLSLDTARVHYDEIVVRGAYHHRPATVTRALDVLARHCLPVDLLLSCEMPLERTAEALRSMLRRESLKVVLRPGSQSFEK